MGDHVVQACVEPRRFFASLCDCRSCFWKKYFPPLSENLSPLVAPGADRVHLVILKQVIVALAGTKKKWERERRGRDGEGRERR